MQTLQETLALLLKTTTLKWVTSVDGTLSIIAAQSQTGIQKQLALKFDTLSQKVRIDKI